MMKIIKNQVFFISLLLLQIGSLVAEIDIQQPSIVYKPLVTEIAPKVAQARAVGVKAQVAPKILPGSKDDSFLPSSKPVVAQKYKQRGVMFEDRPKSITEVVSDMPVVMAVAEPAEPIDDNFADSGLLEYSGLKQVEAQPIHEIAIAKVHAVAGPESYNAQGKVIRKDFVDTQGNSHHITYDAGVETEVIIGKDGHIMQQIITQADKSSEIRLYAYDDASKKNVLQSIETNLPDGTSVFKRVYGGKMIRAQVRNKAGEIESQTHRDNFNRINTTTYNGVRMLNRSQRAATDTDHDVIAPRSAGSLSSGIGTSSGVIRNADGTTITIGRDAAGQEIRTVKNEAGGVIETFVRVDNAIENTKYDPSGKIISKEIWYDDGHEEVINYDVNGKMTLKVMYDLDGGREEIFYDQNGILNSKSNYSIDGYLLTERLYDINERMIVKKTFYFDGSRTEIDFDINGVESIKSLETFYDAAGKKRWQTDQPSMTMAIFSDDGSYKIIKYRDWIGGDIKSISKYDAEGNIIPTGGASQTPVLAGTMN